MADVRRRVQWGGWGGTRTLRAHQGRNVEQARFADENERVARFYLLFGVGRGVAYC